MVQRKLGEVSFELGDFVLWFACEITRGFGWLGVGRVPIRFGGENLKGKPNYDVGTGSKMVAQSIFLTGQLIRYRASCPVERFSEIRIKPSKRSFLQQNLV